LTCVYDSTVWTVAFTPPKVTSLSLFKSNFSDDQGDRRSLACGRRD
jgi:hypothetical protein